MSEWMNDTETKQPPLSKFQCVRLLFSHLSTYAKYCTQGIYSNPKLQPNLREAKIKTKRQRKSWLLCSRTLYLLYNIPSAYICYDWYIYKVANSRLVCGNNEFGLVLSYSCSDTLFFCYRGFSGGSPPFTGHQSLPTVGLLVKRLLREANLRRFPIGLSPHRPIQYEI